MDLRPLSARSVLVSLMLGAHPRGLSARELVQAGEHFGVPAATARVALTRAVTAGDLVRQSDGYGLGARLAARDQKHGLIAWNGEWEMAVVVAPGRPSNERAALRQTMNKARMAELREGVWMRPANLDRPLPRSDGTLQAFTATPGEAPAVLAGALWDLPGWAKETSSTLALLEDASDPAERFTLAAHLARQVTSDPLLPPELRPQNWPGERAAQAYRGFETEVRRVIET